MLVTWLVPLLVVAAMPLAPSRSAYAAGNYSSAVLADTPSAYWRLDEAPGLTTAADSSGHSNTAGLVGAFTLGSLGAIIGDPDPAASFSGSNGAGKLASAVVSSVSNWSLEAWIRPAVLPQQGIVEYVGKVDAGQGGFGIGIGAPTGGSGSNLIAIFGSAGTSDSGYTLSAGQWYHVAATRDSTTVRFYVNGAATAKTSATVPTSPATNSSFGGGVNLAGSVVQPFNGAIDEVAMYATPLSAGRVSAHYQEGSGAVGGLGTWAQQAPASQPPARTGGALAFDSARSKSVLFGGQSATGVALADTWTWDGTAWTHPSPASSPPARWGASLVYDAATSYTLLFGGQSTTSTYLNDTWKWDGTTWTKLTPATAPTVRAGAAAAYHASKSQVVLFGGQSGTSTYQGDTWTWNGTTWTKLTPATSPSARGWSTASNHDASSSVLLFGGAGTTGPLADTWSWNGTTWVLQGGAAPSSRYMATAAYDAITSSVVLFGGTVNGTSALGDTWSWSGASWALQAPSAAAAARFGSSAAYSASSGVVTLYGGNTGSAALADTWVWKTPPGVPGGLSVSAGNAQVTVTWTAPSSGGSPITGYRLIPYLGTTPGTPVVTSASPDTITGLSNGSTYTVRVQATNSVGQGAQATSGAVTPVTVPDGPTAVSATPGNAQATVSWSAPGWNGGAAITGYTVTPYVGASAKTATTVGNVTSTAITGLTNGTAYTFKVAAKNSAGTGAQSAASAAVTPATIPSAPGAPTAIGYNQQAVVTWTAASNGGTAITSYTITPFIGAAGQTPVAAPATATSATVNGLTNGTGYTFKISATNALGTGPVATTPGTTTPQPVPSAPGSASAVMASGTSVRVSWSAASSNGSAVTGYTVTPYHSGTAGTPVSVGAGTLSATVTGLTTGFTYTFQIVATSSLGNGPPATTPGVTLSTTVPGAPSNVLATAGANQATVTWTAAAANGSAVSTYLVTANSGSAQNSLAVLGTTTTATLTGLIGGTSYTFTVVAYNSFGAGPPSPASAGVLPTGASSTYASTALANLPPPALLWRLDDTSSTVAADSSGNARNGTYKGSGRSIVPGALANDPDGATAFNATYTQLTNTAGLPTGSSPRSFEAWVQNPNGTLGGYGTNGSTAHQEFVVIAYGSTVSVLLGQDTQSFPTPFRLYGGWHQLVVTYDGAYALTAYVDGQTLGTHALASSLNTVVSAAGLNVARDPTCSCSYMYGSVDEFAIYPAQLSSGQVGAHFAASGNGTPQAPGITSVTAGVNQATVVWSAAASPSSPLTGYLVTASSASGTGPATFVPPGSTSATLTGLVSGVPSTIRVQGVNNFGVGAIGNSSAVIPSGAAQTYSSSVLADGPAAYYRLDDSGMYLAADSSGHGNLAIYDNLATQGVAGALLSDPDAAVATGYYGSSLACTCAWGLPGGASPRTVEFWSPTGGSVGPGSGSNNAFGAFTLVATSSSVMLSVDSSVTYTFAKVTPWSSSTWHLYTATYDGTTVRVFVDGLIVGSAVPPQPLATSFGPLQMATGRGGLDEVAIYGSALSSGEVLKHFQLSGNGRPTAPTAIATAAGSNQVSVSWTPPADPAGSRVQTYLVQAYVGVQPLNAVYSNTNPTVVTGLSSANTYTFQVQAWNDFGGGDWSAASAAVTPSGAATTYASTVLADSPAVYYRLDDVNGFFIADSSGHGLTGQYTSQAGSSSSGALPSDPSSLGAVMVYPNAGQTESAGALPQGANDRTYEFWFDSASGAGTQHGDFQITVAGPSMSVYLGGQVYPFSFGLAVNGGWHHAVVTYVKSTSVVAAFLDGLPLGSRTVSAPPATAPTPFVLVGGWETYYQSYDEVAVYAYALTAGQVAAHFAASGNARPSQAGAPSAAGGSNQATVSWSAPSSGPPDAYLVQATEGGGPAGSVTVPGTATTATLTGLAAASAAIFHVTAVNRFGVGTASSASPPTVITGLGSTYASVVLGESPAPSVYYRLGDGSTSYAADSSATSAIATGAFTPGPSALVGDPNGSMAAGGRLTNSGAGLPLGSSARTVEFWAAGTTAGDVVSLGGDVTVSVDSFRVVVATAAGGLLQFGTSFNLLQGGWHQVVVAYDGSLGISAFVDGSSLGTQSLTAALQTSVSSARMDFAVSTTYPCGICTAWVGTIDEVSVFPGALQLPAVSHHFQASGNQRPAAATALSATAGIKQATISWTPSWPSSGSQPQTYQVTAFSGTAQVNSEFVAGTATSAVISGLSAGTGYSFTVTGYDTSGPGVPSAKSNTVTPTGDNQTPYAAAVISSGPALYYRMGDMAGTLAADSSGNGRTGVYIVPAPQGSWSLGNPGALTNDPDTAYYVQQDLFGQPGCLQYPARVGLPSGNAPLAVETWFKTDDWTTYYNSDYSYGPDQTLFNVDGINVDMFESHTLDGFSTPYQVTDAHWHQFVVSFDGTTRTDYLDGLPIGSVAWSPGTPTGAVVEFGCNHQRIYYDEASVYAHALASSDVTAHFAASGHAAALAPNLTSAVAGGANSVTVTWSLPVAAADPVTEWIVQAMTAGGVVVAKGVPPAATSAPITGLSPTSSYTFTVKGLNEYGYGTPSNVSAPVSPAAGGGTYPAAVAADAPAAYFRLGDGAVPYGADSSGHGWLSGLDVTGLAGALSADADTAANFAWIPLGMPVPDGNHPRAIEFWTNGPSTVTYGGAQTGSQFTLTVAGDSLSLIDSATPNATFPLPYYLFRGGWHHIVVSYDGTALTTLYVDTRQVGTVAGTWYTKDDGRGLGLSGPTDELAVYGASLSSGRVSAHFAAAGWSVPGAPTNVSAVAGTNQATVSWTAPSASSPAVDSYIVQAFAGITPENAVATNGTATSATLTGLAGGTAFTFKVTAVNNVGPGTAGATPTAVTPSGGTTYASTVIADQPAFYFRLGDSSASLAADSSAHAATGLYDAGWLTAASSLPSDPNGSLALTGTQRLREPLSASVPSTGTPRSYEWWFSTTVAATQTMLSIGDGVALVDLANGNQIQVTAGGQTLTFTAAWPLNQGAWHHVVLTYDGSLTLGIYIDGLAIPSQTLGAANMTGVVALGGLPVANCSACATFSGSVDEFATYPAVLSATQVSSHFSAAGYVPPQPPINVTAYATPYGANVCWNASPTAGVTRYILTATQNGVTGSAVGVDATLTCATLSALKAGVLTTITLRALLGNILGAGVSSSPFTPTNPDPAPNPLDALGIYTAYGDCWPGGGHTGCFYPTPWSGSADNDNGGVMLLNAGPDPINADVTVAGVDYGNLTVAPGGSAFKILGDTSDTINCHNVQPVSVTISAGGYSNTYSDGLILIGNGDPPACGGGNEGEPWELLAGGSAFPAMIGGYLSAPAPGEKLSPNRSEMSTGDCAADPIDVCRGAFWHTYGDLAIPGRGVPISFSHTYQALAAGSDGPLGYGWTGNYTSFLCREPTSGSILAHQADGTLVPFFPDGSGGYAPPSHAFASLTHNADSTWTFKGKDQVSYIYSSRGQLIQERDLNGYATVLSYTNNQLAQVTDPAGRTLTVQWTGSHITSIQDFTGRQVTFQYDTNGNLQQHNDVANQPYKFGYDANHLLQTITDPNNGVVTNQYDAQARVVKQWDALNRLTQFAYGNGQTTVTDPMGNITVDTFRGDQLIQQTRASGTPQQATWTFAYDPVTLGMTAQTDPNSHVTATTFDPQGNPLTQTDALNRQTVYTYNAFNEPLTMRDPKGITTTMAYDGAGNLQSRSQPVVETGQTIITQYKYDDAAHPGDVTRVIDPDGKVWQSTYDQYGFPATSTDPLGDKSTSTYDSLGRMLSAVSPNGNVNGANPALYKTSYTYNVFGDPLTATDPLQHKTQLKYDALRNLKQVIRPDNSQTAYTYDADRERTLSTVLDPLGATVTTQGRGFNANSQVQTQTNGLSQSLTFHYDPLGRTDTATDALNRVTTYAYDPAGNMTTVKDAKNQTTTFGYDAGNQLISIAYSDGVTPNVPSIQYDLDGQRTQVIDGTGTRTSTYDSAHRLTQVTDGASQQVRYAYNLRSLPTSLTYPGGVNSVSRAFDDAGRLHTLTDWLSNQTSFSYDANGNLQTETYPNGVVGTFQHDNANRITSVSDALGANAAFLSIGYAQDQLNRLTTDGTTTNGYDSANRLTSSGASTYQYDAANQMKLSTDGTGNQSTFSYDAGNQLQSVSTSHSGTQTQNLAFQFDANGNRTQRTDISNVQTAYTFDQANRLTTAAGVAYAYNSDGLRISKTSGGTTTPFVWDASQTIPTLLKDGQTGFIYAGGLPLEQISAGGVVSYFHQDQLGSTRALTATTGAVVATYAYDAYGNLSSATGTVSSPLRYTGQYTDAETGFVYLRARYYDPSTDQFISRDPLGVVSGGAYVYAAGSPTNLSDPSGLDPLGAVQDAVIWVGQHLPGNGRHNLACVANSAAGWVEHEVTGLTSADPWVRVGTAFGFFQPALMLVLGPEVGLLGDAGTVGAGELAAEETGAVAGRAWSVGDAIDAPTAAGNNPAWSTVRGRYWKNAADAAGDGEYTTTNLARMGRGLAPQEDGVSMELHHILPRHMGGGNEFENLLPVWPDEHAAIDPFRFLAGG